jgi:pimeloyl-ACP methyl ester carboxylesterase
MFETCCRSSRRFGPAAVDWRFVSPPDSHHRVFLRADSVKQIECPLLVGYSKDDRIIDSAGTLRLYEKATNSKREMLEGVGHGEKRFEVRTYIADWFARQFKTL